MIAGKTRIIFEDEIPHLNVCTEFKVPCPNACTNQEFTRAQVSKHCRNH